MNTVVDEKVIEDSLYVIEHNGNNKADAIEYILIEIGKYRLEAEKYSGLIRSTIHKSANDLEKRLNVALENSKF